MDLRKLNNYAVIDKAVLKKIINCNNTYAYTLLNRLSSKNIIHKLFKGKYALDTANIHVVATNIFQPAYLSFWSASYFKGYTEQILNTLDIAVTSRRESIIFQEYKINFVPLGKKMFFGFEKIKYGDFFIFVADDEKLLIDVMANEEYIGNFDEIIKIVEQAKISEQKMALYLKKINNLSLIKRIGFILKKYKKIDLGKYFKITDKNYIRLSRYLTCNKKDSQWRVYYDN
jgi:predicted transcriptional regulator of viral defense system